MASNPLRVRKVVHPASTISVLVGMLLMLVACGMQPVTSPLPPPTVTPQVVATIPFTTIDAWPPFHGNYPEFVGNVELRQQPIQGISFSRNAPMPAGPLEAVIADPGNEAEVFAFLPEETQAAISDVDYDEYLVIFYWHGATDPDVWSYIDAIQLEPAGIRISVQTWKYPELGVGIPVLGLPYHVVAIARSSIPPNLLEQMTELHVTESVREPPQPEEIYP